MLIAKNWLILLNQSNYELADLDLAEGFFSARLKYVKEVRKNFVKRFKNEYLGTSAIHQRKVTNQLKIGDVVWIENDNKRRINWVEE